MTIEFFKYQGTGNDFIIIDNRQYNLSKNDTKIIKNLCDRRFGIGADGLIFLETAENSSEDFKMVYFNADGNQSSMCGNGGRCLVSFANFLGVIKEKASFTAIDGGHEATLTKAGLVSLKMQDVSRIETLDNALFLDTGSPHYVTLSDNISELDVASSGAAIRYNDNYKKQGTNVNFVKQLDSSTFKVRTYERGVEDETLSCGTGVTAVALAMYASEKTIKKKITLETEGGNLEVSFNPKKDGTFTDVWLKGPALQVFKGTVTW